MGASLILVSAKRDTPHPAALREACRIAWHQADCGLILDPLPTCQPAAAAFYRA
jgi:hypothetical protein